MNRYYVLWNGAAWFVKEASFFISQGGLEESWGKAWRPILADSIEDARLKAPQIYPKRKENQMRVTELNQYQDLAVRTAVYPGAGTGSDTAVSYVGFKLAGETGEVMEKIAKYRWRGDSIPNGYQEDGREAYIREVVKKELGDALWYIAAMAFEHGLTLEEIATANVEKLSSRKERGVLKGSGDDR